MINVKLISDISEHNLSLLQFYYYSSSGSYVLLFFL